jgi:hypothetical protein
LPIERARGLALARALEYWFPSILLSTGRMSGLRLGAASWSPAMNGAITCGFRAPGVRDAGLKGPVLAAVPGYALSLDKGKCLPSAVFVGATRPHESE